MSKKLVTTVAVLLLVFASAPSLMAEGKGWEEKQRIENSPDAKSQLERARANRRALPVGSKAPQKVTLFGTITYDDGVANVAPTTTSRCWGNRFDTGGGFPVQASGSITKVSVYMVSISGNAFITIADQLNTGAGTAMNIDSSSYPMTVGWNVVSFTTPFSYVGSSFLAGIWYFGGDVPGLGTGTTGGQGHHGMDINDSAGTLTGYNPSTTFNALFRPMGDLLTPVELRNFEVSDE